MTSTDTSGLQCALWQQHTQTAWPTYCLASRPALACSRARSPSLTHSAGLQVYWCGSVNLCSVLSSALLSPSTGTDSCLCLTRSTVVEIGSNSDEHFVPERGWALTQWTVFLWQILFFTFVSFFISNQFQLYFYKIIMHACIAVGAQMIVQIAQLWYFRQVEAVRRIKGDGCRYEVDRIEEECVSESASIVWVGFW